VDPLTDMPADLVDEIVAKLAAGPQQPQLAVQDLDPLIAQRR
jgi:hypothetical protein